jgi:hypothetical protein
MSEDSSNELQKGKHRLTRRRFVQSTALLTGVSATGGHFIEPSPLQAQESPPEKRLAQVAPMQGARAPATAPEKLFGPPTTSEISVQEFTRLSEVLTGLDGFESDLANQYLLRCAANPELQGQLKRLVQTLSSLHGNRRAIEKGLADALQADGPLFAAAEQIIYLWYIGAFFSVSPSDGQRYWDYGPPDHYFRGKVWTVIGVQPPMTAHGSNNYWSGTLT